MLAGTAPGCGPIWAIAELRMSTPGPAWCRVLFVWYFSVPVLVKGDSRQNAAFCLPQVNFQSCLVAKSEAPRALYRPDSHPRGTQTIRIRGRAGVPLVCASR